MVVILYDCSLDLSLASSSSSSCYFRSISVQEIIFNHKKGPIIVASFLCEGGGVNLTLPPLHVSRKSNL